MISDLFVDVNCSFNRMMNDTVSDVDSAYVSSGGHPCIPAASVGNRCIQAAVVTTAAIAIIVGGSASMQVMLFSLSLLIVLQNLIC